MKLDAWMIKKWPDLSDAARNVALAHICGCTATSIWRYRHGSRTPNHEMLRRIVKATGGEVSANDMLSIPDCDISAT
jgi:hypothetical protein